LAVWANGGLAAPAITWYNNEASATVRARGPTWSSVQLSGTIPSQGSSPLVGFNPTQPQMAAGMRIDPPVSVPIDAQPMPAATAAADPPLEPPADRVVSHGFRTGP